MMVVEPTGYMTRSPSASGPLTYPAFTGNLQSDQVNMEIVDRVTLRCLAKSEHFERKLGKRFVISDNVSQTA